jgi:HSP20 family protein
MADSKEMTLREKEAIEQGDGEPTRAGVYYSPAVDIYETEEAITVYADLPGVAKEGLDINVEDNKLTITGAVAEPDERLQSIYYEYGVGGYTRSFQLGNAIDQPKINAALKDGVLELVLPKAEKLRPRKIEIATA